MSNRFEQQTDEKAQFRQEYATQQGQLQTQAKKRSMGLIIGGVVLALLLIWGIASYNSLTGQREEVRQYFSNIDTELQNHTRTDSKLSRSRKRCNKTGAGGLWRNCKRPFATD